MASSWSSLPAESALHVISFLTPADLVRFSLCSRQCFELCQDKAIWKDLYSSAFPSWFLRGYYRYQQQPQPQAKKVQPRSPALAAVEEAGAAGEFSWKNAFRRSVTLDRNWWQLKHTTKHLVPEEHGLPGGFLRHALSAWSLALTKDLWVCSTAGGDFGVYIFGTDFDLTQEGVHLVCKPLKFLQQGLRDLVNQIYLDGNQLLTVSRVLKVWNMQDYSCTAEVNLVDNNTKSSDGTDEVLLCCHFPASQPNLVVTGSSANRSFLVDVPSGTCLKTLYGHSDFVNCCYTTPNAQMLVTGGGDAKLNLYDLPSGRLLQTLNAHADCINELDASSTEPSTLFSAADDHFVKGWDLRTGKMRVAMEAHKGYIRALKVEGWRLVTGGDDQLIHFWDVRNCKTPAQTLDHHNDLVKSLDFTDSLMLSGSPSEIYVSYFG
ncbi:WD repeat-containing protein 12 [Balamuthia mandrillaris]